MHYAFKRRTLSLLKDRVTLSLVRYIVILLLMMSLVINGNNTYLGTTTLAETKHESTVETLSIIEDEPVPLSQQIIEPTNLLLDTHESNLSILADRIDDNISDIIDDLIIEENPDLPIGFVYIDQIDLNEELQLYTYKRCEEKGIEYTIVLALMWRESRFQHDAQGYNAWNGTYDSGIMQINDCNKGWLYKECGIDNLFDPYQCIDAGTEILGRFAEKYDTHHILMAYQYGEAGMKQKIAQGVTTNKSIEALYVKSAEFKSLMDAASVTSV